MLNFWYSEACNRQIKLTLCIITCVIIYVCSSIQQLTPVFAALSLSLGFMMHLLRHIGLKLSTQAVSQKVMQNLFILIPVSALMLLILYLPAQDKIYLAIQCIAFSALGLFVLSIFVHRAKRFESERSG